MESPEQGSRRRLYPSILDPSFLTLRSRRLILSSWAEQIPGKNLTVLDVGGRLQPYRSLFGDRIGRYVAIDLTRSELVNVVADAERLPFAPSSFDMAIATQVFEFFRDPCKVAQGIHSALKPGGVLFASLASCAPRFVDSERWRFTRAGIGAVFGSFARVEIVPELHSVAGLIRTVNVGFDTFVRYQAARNVYRMTLSPVLNVLGLALEYSGLTDNDQFATNYSVRAVKAR